MSVEAVDPDVSGEVVELFGVEALIRRREWLQAELGRRSALLCEANKLYNECISEIIAVNGALKAEEGFDTNAFGRYLQAEVSENAAVNGYGRHDWQG